MANAKSLAAIPTHFNAKQLRRMGCVQVGQEGGFIIMQSPYGQVYKTRDLDLERMVKRYCKHARDYANQMVGISMFALERVETVVFSAQAAMLESMSWEFAARDEFDSHKLTGPKALGRKPRGKSISQKRASADQIAKVIESTSKS